MNIERLTLHDALQFMGSEATEAEAREMIALLSESGAEDTRDIEMGDWVEMMNRAIHRASNPD